MLDKLLGYKVHPFLQLMGMIVLAVGLPMNKVLMSIGTIWLASNIVLKADFRSYWERWKVSPVFWFVIGIFFLHVAGLIYTTDIDYALRDINTKLPLFVIPTAVIAFPVKRDWIKYILYFYLASLCITSAINIITDWSNPQVDFRSVSLFGSHIRYTILIAMGVLVCLHFIKKNRNLRLVMIIFSTWFVFYVYQSQVFSGYISLLMVLLALLIYFIVKVKHNAIRISLLSITALSIIFCFYFVTQFFSPQLHSADFSNLPEKTPHGNLYMHDTTFAWYENGNHVMSFIAEKELRESWQKRSPIHYDSLDKNGHKIKSTLLRYMTSKGLKKDRDGMSQMTDKDIRNVEDGYTNIDQLSRSPLARLEDLRNQIARYKQTKNPNGNSITERIEHFKIGRLILEDNWLIGVGTGDVQMVFNDYYSKTNTKLDREKWNRAHNQFLTIWLTFGLPGIILFSGLWCFLTIKSIKKQSLFALGFALVAIASFLSEDTIETQQGVTFIAFFLAIIQLSTLIKTKSLK